MRLRQQILKFRDKISDLRINWSEIEELISLEIYLKFGLV